MSPAFWICFALGATYGVFISWIVFVAISIRTLKATVARHDSHITHIAHSESRAAK